MSPQWVVHLNLWYSQVTLVSGYPFWQLPIYHNMDVQKDVHYQVKHRLYIPWTPTNSDKLYSNRVTSDKKRIHTPPLSPQRAKKVVSDSPGLVDFAIGLLNSVINLPNRQVKFFEKFKLQKNCEINLLIKTILGLAEMMFGLVNVSFSLPEW